MPRMKESCHVRMSHDTETEKVADESSRNMKESCHVRMSHGTEEVTDQSCQKKVKN